MTRRNLENNELGGVIREKINDNFIDLYNATGRGVSVLPTLATRFGVSNRIYNGAQFVDEAVTTTYSVARGSAGTYINAIGAIVEVGANVPRYTFDRTTGELLGLLIEEQRTRINTISLLPTVPEVVTVTAAQHTISFYGTGSVVLSGVHSATLVGTGSGRVTLTFTPTAGTLTLTPSGLVNDLQLEIGATASSIIRGEGSAQTRLADNVSRTLGAEFNPNEFSVYVEYKYLSDIAPTSADFGALFDIRDSSVVNRIGVGISNNSARLLTRSDAAGIGFTSTTFSTVVFKAGSKLCLVFSKTLGVSLYIDGALLLSGVFAGANLNSSNLLTLTGAVTRMSNITKGFRYYPRALSSAEAQALTKI